MNTDPRSTTVRGRAWRFRLGMAALAWIVLCLIGEVHGWFRPESFHGSRDRPEEPVVQLRCCSIPYLRPVAVHCFFLSYEPQEGRWHRWEVWQSPQAGGVSWGHLHRDLLGPDEGTGGGPPVVLREWRGDAAVAIQRILFAPEAYPERHTYASWPGPNSNTYPAWVLRQAGVGADLGPRAIGKDYLGWLGAAATAGRGGFQVETPLLGVKLSIQDGAEVHFMSLTLGIDLWMPGIKTPLGRIGFPH